MGMTLHKGPVSKNDLRNGEERLQYHRGRLKLIRKEFGKLFELEFSSPEVKELKTLSKQSDVRKPSRNAIKIFKGGVRVAEDSKLFTTYRILLTLKHKLVKLLWIVAMLYQSNRLFMVVQLDLTDRKLVNFRRTSLRKDTYGI